jgi:hypothetical protein
MLIRIPSLEKTIYVINGINLILKYEPSDQIRHRDKFLNDRLYFGSFSGKQMTPEELDNMKKWGWLEEYDSWATPMA